MIELEVRYRFKIPRDFSHLSTLLSELKTFIDPDVSEDLLSHAYYYRSGVRFKDNILLRKKVLHKTSVMLRSVPMNLIQSAETLSTCWTKRRWREYQIEALLHGGRTETRYIFASDGDARLALTVSGADMTTIHLEFEHEYPLGFFVPAVTMQNKIFNVLIRDILPLLKKLRPLKSMLRFELTSLQRLKRTFPTVSNKFSSNLNPKVQSITMICLQRLLVSGRCAFATKHDGISGQLHLSSCGQNLFKSSLYFDDMSFFCFAVSDTESLLEQRDMVFQVELVERNLIIIDLLSVDKVVVQKSLYFYLEEWPAFMAKFQNSVNYVSLNNEPIPLKFSSQQYFDSPHLVVEGMNKSDGTIIIRENPAGLQYSRFKICDTFELRCTSSDGSTLSDFDGNVYKSCLTESNFQLHDILECRNPASDSVGVQPLKSRPDRIFPNTRVRVLQACCRGETCPPPTNCFT
ncbi:hypothetical protein HDE_00873 [Halotydeus destructor]|nr:hypothetical protein HDE_00873 [Halotydeus destructor]